VASAAAPVSYTRVGASAPPPLLTTTMLLPMAMNCVSEPGATNRNAAGSGRRVGSRLVQAKSSVSETESMGSGSICRMEYPLSQSSNTRYRCFLNAGRGLLPCLWLWLSCARRLDIPGCNLSLALRQALKGTAGTGKAEGPPILSLSLSVVL
jgi:hypothetical protein